MSWLSEHVPPEDGTPGVAAVVHGDFRLDNMVFDPHLQVRGAFNHARLLGYIELGGGVGGCYW